ncbi:right-handed parallel beta-helix repeat-containing protein [Mucilaginibacter sp. PAMB04274]|uniref:right-handed parallel beta-helix repeat-containing protein n=1 Tax=Mucilaginibacter sp. PAMB04274 TaxID=3138568 RepID=UPI0031F60472
MKTKLMIAALVSVIAVTSCKKNNQEPKDVSDQTGTEKVRANSVADHVIETGMTLAQINAVIAGATAGQTVLVQPGTYTITGKINMKAGVSLVKQTTTNPIFDATSLASILTLNYTTDMSNVTLSGITFWNIRMQISGASAPQVKYCLFDYGKRAANTDKSNNLKDDYLEYINTNNALVSNCNFMHRSTDPGRGVWVKGATDTKVLNNTFGNGGTTGYFVCAINDNSQSNSLVDGNIINRNTALNANDALTDHGIYGHSFNGLTISNNTITGWPTNGSGGSVKVRNGQNVTISNNTMNGSGVLLYEYSNLPAFPFLKNVVVMSNTINVSSAASDLYHGIGYYRDNTTDSEYSIKISDNILPNGSIVANDTKINITDFNAAGGGVYNNDTAAGYFLLKAGITNSGNY